MKPTGGMIIIEQFTEWKIQPQHRFQWRAVLELNVIIRANGKVFHLFPFFLSHFHFWVTVKLNYQWPVYDVYFDNIIEFKSANCVWNGEYWTLKIVNGW